MIDGLKGLTPRTRELGRLRTGESAPVVDKQGWPVLRDDGSPKKKPVKRDTWRLTSQSAVLLAVAADLYGGTVEEWPEAPAEGRHYQLATERDSLAVLIPLDHSLSQAFELWSGGGCQRRCDGATEIISDAPCLCPAAIEDRMEAAAKGGACKPTTRLNVLLPDIPDLGFWRLETHSYNAATEIPGALALYTGLARTYAGGDTLEGVLMRAELAIEHRRVKKPDEKFPRQFTVPIIRAPQLTPNMLMTGEVPALGSPGPGVGQRGDHPVALEAGAARHGDSATSAVPPPTDDSRRPFDESDAVLFGLEGERWLVGLCRDAGLSGEDIDEIVMAASGGRTGMASMLYKSEKDAAKRAFAAAVAARPSEPVDA